MCLNPITTYLLINDANNKVMASSQSREVIESLEDMATGLTKLDTIVNACTDCKECRANHT